LNQHLKIKHYELYVKLNIGNENEHENSELSEVKSKASMKKIKIYE